MFDGRRHMPLIALPGHARAHGQDRLGRQDLLAHRLEGRLRLRGAAPIMRVLAKAHQFITFTTPPNLQAAVAYGLGKDDAYFEGMRARLRPQPRPLHGGPRRARLRRDPEPEATYFLNIDIAAARASTDDAAFCRRLVLEHGVAAIPVSAFYAEGAVKNVVRFCFAKQRRDARCGAGAVGGGGEAGGLGRPGFLLALTVAQTVGGVRPDDAQGASARSRRCPLPRSSRTRRSVKSCGADPGSRRRRGGMDPGSRCASPGRPRALRAPRPARRNPNPRKHRHEPDEHVRRQRLARAAAPPPRRRRGGLSSWCWRRGSGLRA